MGARIVEDPTLFYSIQVFQKLLSVRAQERLTNGYSDEPHAFGEGLEDSSGQQFAVAVRLEATEDS